MCYIRIYTYIYMNSILLCEDTRRHLQNRWTPWATCATWNALRGISRSSMVRLIASLWVHQWRHPRDLWSTRRKVPFRKRWCTWAPRPEPLLVPLANGWCRKPAMTITWMPSWGTLNWKARRWDSFFSYLVQGWSNRKKRKRVPLSFYFRLDGRCRTSLHWGKPSKLCDEHQVGLGHLALCETFVSRSRGGTNFWRWSRRAVAFFSTTLGSTVEHMGLSENVVYP